MVVSVDTVQAGAAQTEEKAKEAAELARAKEVYAEHLHKAVQEARRAAEVGRLHLAEQLAQARSHWAEARRHGLESALEGLQERRERVRVSPRIAIRRHGSGRGNIAERVLGMADDLELTEQQEDEIREMRRQDRRASIERDAAIEVAGLDLEELMEDPHAADLGAVEQQMQAIGNLRIASRIAGLRLSQQVWAMLTAAQREQLQDDRHNVFMLRRDGPHGWAFSGDDGGDFVFDLDSNDFMPEEWMNDLDFDFDFDFGSDGDLPFGLWRFRDGLHEDGEVHEDDSEVKTEPSGSSTKTQSVGTRTLF